MTAEQSMFVQQWLKDLKDLLKKKKKEKSEGKHLSHHFQPHVASVGGLLSPCPLSLTSIAPARPDRPSGCIQNSDYLIATAEDLCCPLLVFKIWGLLLGFFFVCVPNETRSRAVWIGNDESVSVCVAEHRRGDEAHPAKQNKVALWISHTVGWSGWSKAKETVRVLVWGLNKDVQVLVGNNLPGDVRSSKRRGAAGRY